MDKLTASSLLRREQLDEHRYAESLLERAAQLGMLDDAFRQRFLRFLRERLIAYSGGRSRSMRRETALSIAESTLFTLSAHLTAFEPLDALAQLSNHSLDESFSAGKLRVCEQLRAAELFYRIERCKPIPFASDLLRDTLEGGLSGFFQLYNPEYGAHEIHITADYPVLFDPQGWRGIEFIRRYLDQLALENRFLRLLVPDDLHQSLARYAAKNRSTPHALCDNLCLIALSNLLPRFETPNSMLDALGCDCDSLRRFILSACRKYDFDLRRIRALIEETP